MVQRDFRITNAALGEEIADENSRSVVRITHQPVNPRDLADDSDSDDEFSFDEDEDDEEEDGMPEESFNMAKIVGPKGGKKADAKKAEAEKAEAESEEDDEDDEDFEEPTATAIACSLIPGKIEQAQLNLTFVADEVVMFEVTGNK